MFFLCTFEKTGIAKMLAPMLDQLNLKLTAFNVQAWTIDACQRKMIETGQTFVGKMASVKVGLCTRRKHCCIRINLQAVVESNFRVVTAAVNELYERATAGVLKHCKLLGQTWYFGKANLQPHGRLWI